MRSTTATWTKRLLLAALLAAVAVLTLIQPSQMDAVQAEDNPVEIYFFWGEGCPHCAKAKPFLEDLAQRYPSVTVHDYEVYYSAENQEYLAEMGLAYGFEPTGVPVIMLGNQHWIGWADLVGEEVEAAVKACLETPCIDAGAGIITDATPSPQVTPEAPIDQNTRTIKVPFIGEVNLADQSLVISTLLIAFVDGFNPCSLWVLSMLLALTLHTGSRKKIFIIGFVFVTVTAAIYALFIAGLFTLLTFISYLTWIQLVVAVVALFFAIVNIKDYFWYKEGISFTIKEEQRPGIFKNMRKVLDANKSIWGLIGATIVLAAGVSLVEFSCTAGFPVVWTNLLSSQNVSTLTFVLLLVLYMVIYQLDELIIFLAAVFTLRASRLEEKQGRILKLVGGILMLTLSLVMIFKPELMNSISSSLIVFGIALAIFLLVLLLHRVILPRLGIHIGSEFKSAKSKKQAQKQRRRH